MNIALWIVACLIAIGYVAGGIIKLTWQYERYAAKLPWAQDYTPGTVKLLGCLEVLGGLGLVLPGALGIAPVLVPVAASAMAMYMSGAVVERIRRAEYADLVGDLVFLAAMLFVAWGRFAVVPLG